METQSIALPDVLLSEFFGAEGRYVALLTEAFPGTVIIPGGGGVRLQGDSASLVRVRGVIDSMRSYYGARGEMSESYVRSCLSGNQPTKLHDVPIMYDAKGEKIVPATAAQERFVDAVEAQDLVFALGPSGTGKTFLSVAMALRFLRQKRVHKIVLTRPVVEAGETLGFLPGDLKEKMDPYLIPMYDALRCLLLEEKLQYFLRHGIVEIAPLAYMRGRTLNNAFIILDEAQNTTSVQIKMFLTRMGPRAKAVITGDDSQVDLVSNKARSGLTEALSLLRTVKGVGMVRFTADGTMRHPLVKEVIAAYEKKSAREGTVKST